MQSYNEKIAILMRKVGINPSFRGYKYITEAIKMAIEDDTVLYRITTRLQPDIAKKFNIQPASIERCMRYAVQTAFYSMSVNAKRAIFGNATTITNAEFIATLAQIIQNEPNNPIWNM